MASTSIIHLPVEIHTSILTLLYTLSRQSALTPSESELSLLRSSPPPDPNLEWIERDRRSKSLFPFNVASTCRLWLDILSQIPGCWTQVVYDVADDPTPFLGAFSWSKDIKGIEMTVFNSSRDGKISKTQENWRVSAIAQALLPHLCRCSSITFDVVYSSSLPPPNTFLHQNLEELVLECLRDDIDISTHPWAHTADEERQGFTVPLPKLIKLSVTGFWFMTLALHDRGQTWLKELTSKQLLHFHISQSEFHAEGPYSLHNFALSLARIRANTPIHFRNLTLVHQYGDSSSNNDTTFFIYGDFNFHSVSKDFITALFSIVTIYPRQSLSFKNCKIPNLGRRLHHPNHLILEEISDADSLRNVLGPWNGTQLTFRSCSSFDDSILSWLGPNEYSAFPATCLTSLFIEDCRDFTTHGLREAIKIRNEAADAGAEVEWIRKLWVSWGAPGLTHQDKVWFQGIAQSTAISWITFNDDGTLDVFAA